jgi:Skp family chaperone for outer membrane proteins
MKKKLYNKKKLFQPRSIKKKVSELRNKVSEIQKERGKLLENVSKQRTKARNEILKNLNPIVKNYMNEKKIRMVMDKKNILLADETLDITKDIMALLNKKLKSINLN